MSFASSGRRDHAFPADARIDAARIDAQFRHLGHLKEAVLALDVLDCLVRAEILRQADAAIAERHPHAGVDVFLAGDVVVRVEGELDEFGARFNQAGVLEFAELPGVARARRRWRTRFRASVRGRRGAAAGRPGPA